MEFSTKYERFIPKGKNFTDDPGKTEQHHAADCDINTVFARFLRTGVLGDPSRHYEMGQYLDVTDAPKDFASAVQMIVDAKEKFAALPSKVRLRFNNDPHQLHAFLEDPQNYEEAVKLNLVTRRADNTSGRHDTPLDITVPTDTKTNGDGIEKQEIPNVR